MKSLELLLSGVLNKVNLKIEDKKMVYLVSGTGKVLVWIELWMFLSMPMQLALQSMVEF
jgi:hypothetical protein